MAKRTKGGADPSPFQVLHENPKGPPLLLAFLVIVGLPMLFVYLTQTHPHLFKKRTL